MSRFRRPFGGCNESKLVCGMEERAVGNVMGKKGRTGLSRVKEGKGAVPKEGQSYRVHTVAKLQQQTLRSKPRHETEQSSK